MTHVAMTKNFKTKSGYFRIDMFEKYENTIKITTSLCYPSDQEGKFVQYIQNTWECSRKEANAFFLKNKKQGYSYTIDK